MKKLILLLLLIIGLFYKADAQKKTARVYYLIDTARIPAADRMFDFYKYPKAYAYKLNCSCLMPWLTDAVFFRTIKDKGTNLSEAEVKQLKLVKLSELISIIVKYSVVRMKGNIYYFIEKNGNIFIKYKVQLLEPYSNYNPGVLGSNMPPK
jgi:hypothetical protein